MNLNITLFITFRDRPRIFNHGQVTGTTNELTSRSPEIHITPTGGRRSSTDLTCPYTVGLQWYQVRTHSTLTTSLLPCSLGYQMPHAA
ncbi:hypothetical protein TNCV_2641241 [Trichonephila clavipes]|nr:hypothetical protein TNCV_2641241 [Trichonephila clavipes]